VAKKFGVALRTVQRWVQRAANDRIDRVAWLDRPRGGRRKTVATSLRIENLILRIRKQLREKSDLGDHGAVMIQLVLKERGLKKIPSVRTIGRILLRRGALDGRRRVRRPPPAKGWYIPRVAAKRADVDCFDFIEDLHLRGGADVNIMTAISLHTGLCASWVRSSWTAKVTAETLIAHWRAHGLPQYAQFDNDTIFCGARQFPDSFGRVIRLCLQLKVIPVFAPPHETGFQAVIESFNGRWQQKVWQRFMHTDHDAIQACADRFTFAARQRAAPRIDAGPARRPFPKNWKPDYQRPSKALSSICVVRTTVVRSRFSGETISLILFGLIVSSELKSISLITKFVFIASDAGIRTSNNSSEP
jgi:hypothetical protein